MKIFILYLSLRHTLHVHNGIIDENVEVLKLPNLSIHNFLWCIEHIQLGQKFLLHSSALTLVLGRIYPMHRICTGPRRVLEALKPDPTRHIRPQMDMSDLSSGSKGLAAGSGWTYLISIRYI
jgi:hypothetical protein